MYAYVQTQTQRQVCYNYEEKRLVLLAWKDERVWVLCIFSTFLIFT